MNTRELAADEWQCANCGYVGKRERPVEELTAEYRAQFPGEAVEQAESVCGACYDQMIAWARKAGLIGGTTH